MLWGIALLLIAANHCTVSVAEAESSTAWPVSRQRGGFVIPLQQRERPSRRRHLLRNGALGVEGSVREVGYFYTNLQLGTPPRKFSVIIDTGSTITYIPCKGCAHCGKHTDEWFDPDSSKTAKKLGCNDPLCNCGTPSCMCNNNRCYYSRTYAERSSSEGWMIEDDFGFPDDQPPVRMVFGCENGETGEIYRQMADGIMGMGNNHNAFQSQLVARGVIDDVFSLCFGYPKDGVLLLGDVRLPDDAKTVYTPLLNNLHLHYYNVKMDSITVDGKQLPLDAAMFDRGYGVVLDSGTTFTYLPSEAFKVMSQAVGQYAEKHGLERTPGADPQYNDICWKGAPDSFDELHKVFPPAEFVFAGNARLSLPPVRYLFLSRPNEYCLGFFDNGGSGTLIGGVSVRDVVITYDRRKSRVGFTSMPCADVAADIASRPRAVNISSPPPPSPPPPTPPPPTPTPPTPTPPTPTPPAPTPPAPPPLSSPQPSPPPPPKSSDEGTKQDSSAASDALEASPSAGTQTHANHSSAGKQQDPVVYKVQALPPSKTKPDAFHKPATVSTQGSIDFRLILAILMAIAGMFVIAELLFFRKTMLGTWIGQLKQRWGRDVSTQGDPELAPLAAPEQPEKGP